jgi:membrane peptidoglycan carboxypeptidase
MNNPKRRPNLNGGRSKKNAYTTKSGKTIKINRSWSDRIKARKDSLARNKALRMSGLPKGRLKRLIYRLEPRRMYRYWFSREGGIMALKLTGIGLVAGFLLLVGLFAYFRKDLPNLRDISGNNIGGSVLYYDKTGDTLLWEDVDGIKRIPVKDELISQYIKDATLAIEDKDFLKHGGFDVRGITRAAWNNAFGGGGKQGGSTITQQLVRLTQTGVGKEQTYKRKIKELILSIELERSYSKKEILTGYLNAAPYGGIEYGAEAAAQNYFHKSAKDLTLAESAMLAAIPKAPYFYSPYSGGFDKPAFIGRQHYILDQMVEQGRIPRDEAEAAKKVDVLATVKERKARYTGIKAPWFVLAAKEQLEEKLGEQGARMGGWKVTTTLDMNLQTLAEEQVANGIAQIRRQNGDSAAFVASDVETGQIVALVGGADFDNEEFGKLNYARRRLPPGSSFKPYDYAALIEHNDNIGAGSVLYDQQGPLEGYPCTNKQRPKDGGNCLWNFDFRYPGPMTLRYALGGSRNVPAVKAMLATGIEKTIDTANGLGLKSGYKCYQDENLEEEGPCYASSAIGDGAFLKLDEHVHAYGTLSRNGRKIPQTYILKVEDAQGKTVEEWKPSEGEQAVRPETAYIVADMMADPNASYFVQKIHNYNGHKFSLKTGTTNDAKDGWLMGFSTKYAAGVWVGHHTRQVEMSGFMENMTRPIWNGWMTKAHENVEPKERPKPSGIQEFPAFIVRAHVGLGSVEPSRSTDLYPGWYKQPKRVNRTSRTIDIVSNKIATDCTPARARKDVNETPADTFSGDPFVNNGQGIASDAQDDVHNCSDAKPRITFAGSPDCGGGSCVFNVSVAAGTHPLHSDRFSGKVNLLIDGRVVQSADVSGPSSVKFTVSSSGRKTVTAEVIDSVLYDATARTTANFGGGRNASSLEFGSATRQGANVVVTWSGGTGPYMVHSKDNGQPICEAPAGATSCSGQDLPPSGAVYVRDSTGAQVEGSVDG